MTAQASSGRAINVIKGVPLVGDLPFTDRSYTFTTMGSFGGDLRGGTSASATAASWNTGNARPMYYVQPANDDKNIPANTVMWTLNVPVPVTIYLDFWGGDTRKIVMLFSVCRAVRLANPKSITIADVNTLGLKDWLLSPTTQWVRQLDESGTAFTPNYGPGPVFSQTFPAGTIEIMGNGGNGHGTFYLFVETNCNVVGGNCPCGGGPSSSAGVIYDGTGFDQYPPINPSSRMFEITTEFKTVQVRF